MKKPNPFIVIILIIMVLSVVTAYASIIAEKAQETNVTQEDEITRLQTDSVTYEAIKPVLDDLATLMNNYEDTLRLNEQLATENKALKDYIKGNKDLWLKEADLSANTR
jgi:peptidoglycan hydrolase CwlO-like protein